MLARFISVSDIRKRFKADYSIVISQPAVQFYLNAPTWRPIIEKMRTEYLAGIMEVPIAHKRIRLERLDNLYKNAVSRGQTSAAKEILSAARDEIEGRSQNQISIMMNKIEMISDEELQERMRKIKEEMARPIDVDSIAIATNA